jgi:hypothetical protein
MQRLERKIVRVKNPAMTRRNEPATPFESHFESFPNAAFRRFERDQAIHDNMHSPGLFSLGRLQRIKMRECPVANQPSIAFLGQSLSERQVLVFVTDQTRRCNENALLGKTSEDLLGSRREIHFLGRDLVLRAMRHRFCREKPRQIGL